MSNLITVFEHQRLEVGQTLNGVVFKKDHFKSLVKFNQQHKDRFFTVGYDRITCTEHVGVIAVPGLTIEVLPKADGRDDENRWQRALIEMLKVAHGLPLHEAGHADLQLQNTSVLEHFLRLYVEELKRLVHQGLVKRYRQHAGSSTALKGRLDLPRHIRQSVVHKERFQVVHQVYDTDHLLHSILHQALAVVEAVSRDPVTIGVAQDMRWAFEHVRHRPVSAATFERIQLDRKTRCYADALQLARLLLLNYAPNMQGGREHILSLLFNMNTLFELVVLKLLQRAARKHPEWELDITGQDRRGFWNGQKIKPDILIRCGEEVLRIIDTKWKVPKDDRPADADLKQMYVYNRQFGSVESMLLYPGEFRSKNKCVNYDLDVIAGPRHGCSVQFIELFHPSGRLNADAVDVLVEELVVTEPAGSTS